MTTTAVAPEAPAPLWGATAPRATDGPVAVPIDAEDGSTHPYGVLVGDPVHFWRAGAPPLSQTYRAPACWTGVVLGFSYDRRSIWLADLAVVDPETGALLIERAVPQSEGRASGATGSPHWGVPASWHRSVTHPLDGP